jgi:NADH-quinone oxidoreductase subunit L
MVEHNLLSLIIFAPLAGAAINWLIGKRLKDKPYYELATGGIACGAIAVSMLVAFYYAFVGDHAALRSTQPVMDHIWTWIEVGKFRADFGLAMDRLSGIYACFVTFVGLLIHIFAVGYMKGDPGFYRFFAYMNLFMFSMLTLVLGDNFLLMFVGWEGVGLCSYLLIGYYTKWDVARVAAKKAFVANRIGDWGVVLGIMLIFTTTGSISFFEKPAQHVTSALSAIAKMPIESFEANTLIAGGVTSIAILLFIGATGKSAQIPLFVWLPDAMAGPTPVSALIHAATMVTAGVYMVVRCNAIYQLAPTAMFIVAIIGAVTAIFAATIGLAQNDIKKVLAYSTVSQLGYMFLACGVGAFVAAIFHVMTHAFFKALLFLGSGSVIHGMNHEQDMRKMGGLHKYMKITAITMAAGWLAICGFPFFSGFFSKDEILWKTWSTTASASFPLFGAVPVNKILWGIAALTALLTAVYMTRLMVMTFWGKERFNQARDEADVHAYSESHDDEHGHDENTSHDEDEDEDHEHAHGPIHPRESHWLMWAPLAVLAVLSVVGGLVGVPHAISRGAIPNVFEHTLEPVIARVGSGEHKTTEPTHGSSINNETHNEQFVLLSTQEQKRDGAPAVTKNEASKEASTHGEHSESAELLLTGVSALLGLGGICIGYALFNRDPLKKMPTILEDKYKVDEIYDATLINPITEFSREGLWKIFDLGFIDGIVHGLGRFVAMIGDSARNLQVGFVRSYVAVIFFGALIVIFYFISKFLQ